MMTVPVQLDLVRLPHGLRRRGQCSSHSLLSFAVMLHFHLLDHAAQSFAMTLTSGFPIQNRAGRGVMTIPCRPGLSVRRLPVAELASLRRPRPLLTISEPQELMPGQALRGDRNAISLHPVLVYGEFL